MLLSSFKPLTLKKIHDKVFLITKTLLSKDSLIIDLGCGYGAFLKRLYNEGYRNLFGVDIKRYDKIDFFNFFKLDLDKDFPKKINNKFDCVVAIEVIEHLLSPFHFLCNVKKILKKNGFLILTTPNLSSFTSRFLYLFFGKPRYFITRKNIKKGGHISPLFFDNLKELLKLAGFTITKVEKVTEEEGIKNFLLFIFSSFFLPFMWFNKNFLYGNSIVIVARRL